MKILPQYGKQIIYRALERIYFPGDNLLKAEDGSGCSYSWIKGLVG
jgi:hypothetical protein